MRAPRQPLALRASATAAASFARASAASSLSKIARVCFTCWAKALYGLLAPYGVERPRMNTCPLCGDELASSSAIRDLPIPAGPNTVTKWRGPPRRRAPRFRSARRARARDRPSEPAPPAARRSADVARTASQAGTGALLPFARPVVPAGTRSTARPDVRLLADEHGSDRGRGLQTRRGVHDVSRDHRLAVLGAAHRARRSPRPCSRRSRTCSPSSSAQSRTANAARTARSASSPYVDRRAEHSHDRVADELLDRAAEALELAATRS